MSSEDKVCSEQNTFIKQEVQQEEREEGSALPIPSPLRAYQTGKNVCVGRLTGNGTSLPLDDTDWSLVVSGYCQYLIIL